MGGLLGFLGSPKVEFSVALNLIFSWLVAYDTQLVDKLANLVKLVRLRFFFLML